MANAVLPDRPRSDRYFFHRMYLPLYYESFILFRHFLGSLVQFCGSGKKVIALTPNRTALFPTPTVPQILTLPWMASPEEGGA